MLNLFGKRMNVKHIRFHFLDLMLSVTVITLLLGTRVLVVAGGTALGVVAAGFSGAVEVIVSDSGDIALGRVLSRHV